MTNTYSHEGITWVDLESPTHEELVAVAEKYALNPMVLEELEAPSDRPKVDLYEHFMYLILHFPTLGRASGMPAAEEVDCVIGKDFLITVHYEPVDALREVAGMFEVDSILKKQGRSVHAGSIFFMIIRRMYRSLEERLESIAQDLDTAKKRIFAGEERVMVERLSSIGRTLLDFRIAIKPHAIVWESFEKAGGHLFDKKFSYYLTSISGGYNKVWNMLEGNKEILADLRDTNDSLLNTKMNETMIHLTMMAFVTFPLTLIAAIFAIPADHTPIIGSPNDFWLIVAVMFFAATLIFSFFKYRKWL